MSKTIQVRDVDDATYTTLRTRAARENLSLAAYLKRQLDDMASGPTMDELLRRADERRATGMGVDRDTIVSVQREIRDAE